VKCYAPIVSRPLSRAHCLAPIVSRPLSRAHCLAPIVSRLNLTLLLAFAVFCPCHAAPAIPWNTSTQGGFVTALTTDQKGHVWAATEEDGLWRYDPAHSHWTQFTTQSTHGGLGDDDLYSLTCDRLGRVWAGTGRDGVSVFNGNTWRTYDRLTGPLGCHVVALATSPLNGDVWGCTEAGLFCYSLVHKTWRYITCANGLPSDQPDCLAFSKQGTLFVGTLCDGLGIASPANNYTHWQHIPGPTTLPDTPGGDGLPSALINCLLVSKFGVVYAGTDCGLAHSTDNGQHWRFLRGADWQAKLAGLYHPVPPRETDTSGLLMSEDYVTALAEDGAGHLYIGHRQKGLGVFDEVTVQGVPTPGAYGGYVKALLPTSHGHLLIGTYGDGLTTMPCAPASSAATSAALSKLSSAFAPLPAPAAPPTAAQLAAMLRRVKSLGAAPSGIEATFLGEDWQTQGDEIGRYGRQYAVLCAMNHVITCTNRYAVTGVMGNHHDPGDGLRWWVTWMQTDTPRSLYTPVAGVRRQAEWDDHGEAYPMTHEGPDIWIALHLGEGDWHRVSLYFMNKDGQTADNRFRDYIVEVKPFRGTVAASDAAPVLVRARVRDFWGGVYECFLLHSPGDYAIKIAKNGSLNTILSGVFIDKVRGKPTVEDGEALAYMNGVHYAPPPANPVPLSGRASEAEALWATLNTAYGASAGAEMQVPDRLLAYRALAASHGPASVLANWRWSLRLWTAADLGEFDAAMAHARSAGVKLAHARTPAEVAAASE
jgi:hypothetical protein